MPEQCLGCEEDVDAVEDLLSCEDCGDEICCSCVEKHGDSLLCYACHEQRLVEGVDE